MMLVPHACVNAAAGLFFKKPLTAFAAGIAAHALLDLVPHKDVSAHRAEGMAVGLLLGITSTSCGFSSPAFWCAMGGVLPDVEHVLPWAQPERGRRRFFPTHNRHFHSLSLPAAPKWRVSLLQQTAVSLGALALILTACKKRKGT